MLWLVLLVLAQDTGCVGAPVGIALAEAFVRVESFDLAGAADRFGAAAELGCAEAAISAQYLEGLLAARAAYREGGTAAALAPVRRAIEQLEGHAADGSAPARIAAFVLRAAAAGAQSERGEMEIYLEHAIDIEALQILAGEPAAPVLSAHEVAGDLWLQVHRYEDAHRAYLRAAGQVGATPVVRLGVARSAARMDDTATACREYAALTAWWGSRPVEPAEIAEARAFLDTDACRVPGP